MTKKYKESGFKLQKYIGTHIGADYLSLVLLLHKYPRKYKQSSLEILHNSWMTLSVLYKLYSDLETLAVTIQ